MRFDIGAHATHSDVRDQGLYMHEEEIKLNADSL